MSPEKPLAEERRSATLDLSLVGVGRSAEETRREPPPRQQPEDACPL